MELKKKVSSIIVTFNRKEKLKKAINALLGQTYPIYKIYIIDNASTDGTFEYISDLINKNSSIIYFKMKENLGGSGGFCEGFKQALTDKPDFFWACDDDALADRDALEQMLNKGSIIKEPTVFFSRIIIDSKPPHDLYKVSRKDVKYKGHFALKYATFASLLVPYEIVKDIGIPRGDLFILGDDTEYSMRINKAGYKILYIKDSIVHHPEQIKEKMTKKILGKEISYYKQAKWRYYYSTRNILLIFSYPSKFKILVIHGISLFKMLIFNRQDIPIFLKGVFHGLIGKSGKIEIK